MVIPSFLVNLGSFIHQQVLVIYSILKTAAILKPILDSRLPTLGQVKVKDGAEDVTKQITLEVIEEMLSPRVIESHLPFYLLPPRLVDTNQLIQMFHCIY